MVKISTEKWQLSMASKAVGERFWNQTSLSAYTSIFMYWSAVIHRAGIVCPNLQWMFESNWLLLKCTDILDPSIKSTACFIRQSAGAHMPRITLLFLPSRESWWRDNLEALQYSIILLPNVFLHPTDLSSILPGVRKAVCCGHLVSVLNSRCSVTCVRSLPCLNCCLENRQPLITQLVKQKLNSDILLFIHKLSIIFYHSVCATTCCMYVLKSMEVATMNKTRHRRTFYI